MADLARLPLHDLHVALGARMGPFAGWDMPVHYPAGVLKEHLHTRAAASLFDVSHMGQFALRAPSGRAADAGAALERLVPADLAGLAPRRQRYALLTSDAGGILDDLMVAQAGDHLALVVNAGRAADDLAHLRAHLPDLEVTAPAGRALLALQGPGAGAAFAALVPEAGAMRFMDARALDWRGVALFATRSGYTGEDGFEIAVPLPAAADLARALLAEPGVAPAGLGARDSLRLEAGLPLYGQDMDAATTPATAGLGWAVSPARRPGGARPGGFPGAAVILAEAASGPARRRAGLRPEGRAPWRPGVALCDAGGAAIGTVASGGFAPSLDAPVATAILPATLALGDTVWGELRGRRVPAQLVRLPFRPPAYRR